MLSKPAIAGISLFLFGIYRYLLYPIFLSPLSKIPNAHPTSALSPAWMLWNRFNGRESTSVHTAHMKYGPVVRLAPNEIGINCVDGGTRTVYGGGFERPELYTHLFANYGITNMVSIVPSKSHSIRKRMLSNIYSKSYLFSSPHLQAISQTIMYDRLLPAIQSVGENKILDVLELFYAVNMDLMSGYLFGLANGTNFLQDEKTRKHWLSIYQDRKPHTFWQPELPGLTRWLARIGIRVVPRAFDTATQEIEAWCLSMCDAAEHTLATHPSTDAQDPKSEPLVYKQLKHGLKKDRSNPPSNIPLPDQRLSIASEMLDHLVAGFDTSGITLTYLTHALSLRPHLQSRLRAELLTLSPALFSPYANETGTTPSLPSPKAIDALPLLHAVIMETLRLHPPVPIGQPRVTPSSSTTTLGGYTDIPPGTRVNAQAYSLHRNAEVFPAPEEWRPERWLEGENEEEGGGRDEKSRWFWAFGSGGRMCVGSNFAMHGKLKDYLFPAGIGDGKAGLNVLLTPSADGLGLKLITAAVYTNYRTSVVDDEGIEQVQSFIAGPKAGKLVLKFDHV